PATAAQLLRDRRPRQLLPVLPPARALARRAYLDDACHHLRSAPLSVSFPPAVRWARLVNFEAPQSVLAQTPAADLFPARPAPCLRALVSAGREVDRLPLAAPA